MSAGRFIVFEGGEACGKSTQAARLAERIGAVLTREPGGTVVGGRIRELVLGLETQGLADRAEALLIAADRAQHVEEVVRPALARGAHVVSDRYVGSSLAYQGIGRGLGVEPVRAISTWATGGLWPDAVVLLDVPPEVAAARQGGAQDRMEAQGDAFHTRVLEGFAGLARTEPGWVVVDGIGSVEEVETRVGAALDGLLGVGWHRRPADPA